MNKVKARNLKGFRDLLPGEMIARDKIISVIKEIFESYGFVSLSTPALESKEILLCYGEESSKQIYLFRDRDGEEVGLRYDLTVPLSRVVAQYQQIPRPFRRYQIQPVWRFDKPDPGRFREFLQFDIDTVGTDSMMADAEIIAAMSECLDKLGLNYNVRFSNRKVLNSLMKFAGIPADMMKDVLRVIDKLDKKGLEGVKEDMRKPRSKNIGAAYAGNIEDFGLGLNEEQISRVEEFILLPQRTRKEALDSVSELFKDIEGSEEGIRELREIDEFLTALEIPDKCASIDLSIARGLDYYTGPVFEAFLTDKKVRNFGSVMGGGRFDELIERYIGQKIPATGASIGIDRLFAAMEKMKLADSRPSVADVLVTVMMKEKMAQYQKIARKLRAAGLNAEVYMGKQKSIGKQMKYADRQRIPIVLIIGPDEFERGQVSIKDLRVIEQKQVDIKDRETWVKVRIGQKTVPMENMIEEIKEMLSWK